MKSLEDLLETLQKYGVTHFEGAGLSVTLGVKTEAATLPVSEIPTIKTKTAEEEADEILFYSSPTR